ncbi:hypothetical protein KUH03_31335 [Sphingobacterium sp. E70]|uniref:hypothetical protein n=1 Tax=Sphingobacterium sp. E70 TaxID=2853439 RepID=UPI00211CCF8B|nr:hypothetical protein [Sphingobacterium sp. E70]ULT23627.1 hypothetical protein KUH03_31335 [Sphingobacterium sp. E70]
MLLYGFSVLCSSYSFGQINIQANNESALSVMKQIEKQSAYHFVYDEAQLTIPKLNFASTMSRSRRPWMQHLRPTTSSTRLSKTPFY